MDTKDFGSTLKDSSGYWASNTYTPLTAGYYFVSYTDSITNNSSGTNEAFAIYKNGSVYNQVPTANPSAMAGPYGTTVTAIVQCNGSTDYIQFFCYSTSASATAQGSGFSYASIFRVF